MLDSHADADAGGVAHPAGDKLLFSGILQAHRSPRPLGQHRRQGSQPGLVLVAVAAAQIGTDDLDLLEWDVQSSRQGRPVWAKPNE